MELLFFLHIWTCGWSEEVKEQTSKFCLNKFNFKCAQTLRPLQMIGEQQLLCWAGRQDDVSHFRFGGMLLLAGTTRSACWPYSPELHNNFSIISPQLNVHFLESSSVFNKVLTFLPQKEKGKKKKRKSSVFNYSNIQFENKWQNIKTSSLM